MKIPKGKGRKSNAETYRDAMAVVKLVDVDGLEVEDAARQLGLTRSTAYRLLSRARSSILAPQVETDRKAAEPVVKEWYEPGPEQIKKGFTPSRPDPAESEPTTVTALEPVPEQPWEWEHLMSREEFLKRTPFRQKQLIAQWTENIALGGKWAITLRGKPRVGPCFGNCPMGNCTCHDREDF